MAAVVRGRRTRGTWAGRGATGEERCFIMDKDDLGRGGGEDQGEKRRQRRQEVKAWNNVRDAIKMEPGEEGGERSADENRGRGVRGRTERDLLRADPNALVLALHGTPRERVRGGGGRE
eukprot:752126-Hanusia_phi.AAC.1